MKIAAFMKKVTKKHTEVLDPTGNKHRIDPSKEMIVKRGGFGNGRAEDVELELVKNDINQQSRNIKKWEAERKAMLSQDEIDFLGPE